MPRRICICTGCPNHHQHQTTYDRDTAPGQRCPPCQAAATAQRNARPGSSSRGLGWDFTRRKAADPAWQAATHCPQRMPLPRSLNHPLAFFSALVPSTSP